MTGGEYRDSHGFTVGSVVAGYRLEEQIGRGGMAVVYRARDVQLGRNVALKLLAPVLALDDAFRQRFIRESRAAAAVDHPYIIPIFAAGESEGVLFIAMRYVQGGDVRTLLDAIGSLPPGRAAGIITQVALALDAAHLHGLVHRDIKPANMLLDSVAGSGQRDHVYLADFGLSKRSLSVTGLTSIGQFLGTPAYVAPEQVEGRPVDSRADQYALACASFEILSGAPPYQRDDDLAVMWAHVSTPPPSLSGQRPELPAAVDAVIARAMAKSPADRFPTCIAFALALRQALGADASPPDLAAAEPGPPTAVSGPPAGEAAEAPGPSGPAAHPVTEILWPRARHPADPAPADQGPPAAAGDEYPATTGWEAAAAGRRRSTSGSRAARAAPPAPDPPAPDPPAPNPPAPNPPAPNPPAPNPPAPNPRGPGPRGLDLRGLDLGGLDLRGPDLRGPDRPRPGPPGPDRPALDLRGPDLRGLDLRGLDLRGLDLRGLDLRGLDLRGQDLRGQDPGGLDLRGPDLRGLDLGGLDLRGPDRPRPGPPGPHRPALDLRGLDLRGLDRPRPGPPDPDRPGLDRDRGTPRQSLRTRTSPRPWTDGCRPFAGAAGCRPGRALPTRTAGYRPGRSTAAGCPRPGRRSVAARPRAGRSRRAVRANGRSGGRGVPRSSAVRSRPGSRSEP